MNYLDEIEIDKCRVLRFFLVFSRMEFALKLAGYVCGNENFAKPNWKEFAKTLSNFDPNRKKALRVACCYYFANPPKKQILSNGELSWSDTEQDGQNDINKLLDLVCSVRNNLFHGGKYNAQDHAENARNAELLAHGICILEETMRLNKKVKRAYDGVGI